MDEMLPELMEKIPQLWYEQKNVLLEKNDKYKGSAFEGGSYALIGNMFRQNDKMLRLKYLIEYLIETGDLPDAFGESIRDTMADQAGYAILGVAICDKLGIGK